MSTNIENKQCPMDLLSKTDSLAVDAMIELTGGAKATSLKQDVSGVSHPHHKKSHHQAVTKVADTPVDPFEAISLANAQAIEALAELETGVIAKDLPVPKAKSTAVDKPEDITALLSKNETFAVEAMLELTEGIPAVHLKQSSPHAHKSKAEDPMTILSTNDSLAIDAMLELTEGKPAVALKQTTASTSLGKAEDPMALLSTNDSLAIDAILELTEGNVPAVESAQFEAGSETQDPLALLTVNDTLAVMALQELTNPVPSKSEDVVDKASENPATSELQELGHLHIAGLNSAENEAVEQAIELVISQAAEDMLAHEKHTHTKHSKHDKNAKHRKNAKDDGILQFDIEIQVEEAAPETMQHSHKINNSQGINEVTIVELIESQKDVEQTIKPTAIHGQRHHIPHNANKNPKQAYLRSKGVREEPESLDSSVPIAN